MTRPCTPEELDRLHAAGLSAVGHYNTPRTESDGEIVLGVLAGNDRYLKPAYCAGIRAEAARMEAERDPAKSDLLTELDRVKARFATRCDECAELRAEFARVTAERNALHEAIKGAHVIVEAARADLAATNASLAALRSRLRLADSDNLDDALSDLIGHSEWLRGVESECARILGVEADGDIREAAAQCVRERDAANKRADKAERQRDEAKAATLTAEKEKAEREIGQYIDAIRAHLPLYTYDDGTDDEASPVECVEYAGDEIKGLRRDVATLKAEAARVGPLVAAAEAYRDVCAPVKGSDVAAAELTGYLEADEALIAAALALPVRP